MAVKTLVFCFFVGVRLSLVSSLVELNCTNPHEHYACGSACQNECATLGEVCPIVNIRCNDACYCDEGYARDAKGVCIPECECPPKPPKPNCTNPHEHYECGSACQTECATLGEPCPIINIRCNDGCYCDEGYARDAKGVCIPECDCPRKLSKRDRVSVELNCTNPHEHYACGSACQNECATLGEVCPIVNIRCNDACYCDEGYARDAKGVCIPECECPPKPPKPNCTNPHEHYECGSACQTECATLGEPCPIINIRCNDDCYCDEGYARDSKGVCIPECECPPKPPKPNCTNPHEHYECGSACQTECATLGEPCPIINIRCNDDCYCDDGYARDAKGVCIPQSKCPPKSPILNCTKPHEHYECGSACQNECGRLGEVCPIINIRCNDACYCDEGYARNWRGVCIPEHECPPKIPKPNCTNPHEHYECGSACQTECATLGEPCLVFNVKCNDACYCNEVYARDAKGVCIPQCKCPPKPPKNYCTNPHEHYECGSACQNECATLGERCPIVNKKCINTCYCDKGYARDINGICIPELDCPPKETP